MNASSILRRIASLGGVERISFFETLSSFGDEGRFHFLLILSAANEESRAELYGGMNGNAVARWEDQRRSRESPSGDAVHEAEQHVREILEEIISIAEEICTEDIGIGEFSEGELQLLIAMKRTVNRGKEANRETLLQFGRDHFHRYLVAWDEAFRTLIDANLLVEHQEVYGLTSRGRVWANIAGRDRPLWLYQYNEVYARAEESRAHSAFCRRVFGEDLCQLGQADMGQLRALVERLDMGPGSRVLDVGCGNGMITEYFSDLTGARITGIDVADEAIARARFRTRDKSDRLEF